MACRDAVVGLLVVVGLGHAVHGQTWIGPTGRTVISRPLELSALSPRDLTGDCVVNDADYAVGFVVRMEAIYGPEMNPGDLDGDGVVTASDQIEALARLVRASFGVVAASDGEVGVDDITVVAASFGTRAISYDLTGDGLVGNSDLIEVVSRYGDRPNGHEVYQIARELYTYLGLVAEHGVEAFMASGCAFGTQPPPGHIVGVSRTWPRIAPPWWPPNHQTSVSNMYDDHLTATSATYPPNHHADVSAGWEDEDNDSHDEALSATWPPSHWADASRSWDEEEPGDHDQASSATWFPNHWGSASRNREFPPEHGATVSGGWDHGTDRSSQEFPPNHIFGVSQSYGPHSVGVSVSWPPSHVRGASNSWPGPMPWPPSHIATRSSEWGDPAPGPWPVFPHDHNWLDSFNETNPF